MYIHKCCLTKISLAPEIMSCTDCTNTDHFCAGFKCSDFHVFRARAVTR